MFYILDEDKIVLYNENKQILKDTLSFMPNYKDLPILETEKEIINFKDGIYFKEDIQEELNQQEKERIGNLSMTRGDLLEALILAFDKDENDLLEIIETLEITETEKKLYINRLKNALDFYRKHPAVDLIGAVLGITPEQMDNFFITKDYNELLPLQ